MAIRDILLQLNSYPEPTPSWAIDSAAFIAEQLQAKLSVGLCQVQFPDVSNLLSQLLVHSRDVMAAENAKSARNATQLMLAVDGKVSVENRGETAIIDCPAFVTPWRLAPRARTYDLIIVPMYGHSETSSIIEGLVFESGRPVLVLPPAGAAGHQFQNLVIGWDGSRAAARALADPLPLCERARSVSIASVTGEKELRDAPSATDAVRHLARHGIEAKAIEIQAEERNAGSALIDYCKQTGVDLLVMGAYGHARAREFVLGGATRAVIVDPHVPVLLSH